MKLNELLKLAREKFELSDDSVELEQLEDLEEGEEGQVGILYVPEEKEEEVNSWLEENMGDELHGMDLRAGNIGGFAISTLELDETFAEGIEDEADDEDDEDISSVVEEVLATESREDLRTVLEKRMKVVRGGKVVTVNVKPKGKKKRKMSAKQKAALKKARKKGSTAGAKKARAKSMKKRKSSGM